MMKIHGVKLLPGKTPEDNASKARVREIVSMREEQ